MNLIFLYGPPATGKLTVATELSKLTGYKIFHNHLTQDLAREIYPDFSTDRFRLVGKIRLDVFECAAESGTDLIFTYVYTGDDDEKEFINNTVRIVTERGGRVHFVKLFAPIKTLTERVASESRQKFGKLLDPEKLKSFLDEHDTYIKITHEHDLTIDTSKVNPEAAAQLIVGRYKVGSR